MALLCVLATSSAAAAGDTTRVSVSVSGLQANSASSSSSITSDGRYVAFVSNASNLEAGDTKGQLDEFVRDLKMGTTLRVSVASDGTEAAAPSLNPSVSDDGRYVAFSTRAPLVPEDTNGVEDVFVRDRDTDGVFNEQEPSLPSG